MPALPLPPLPPSVSPHSRPAAGEFTFSMLIQPSHKMCVQGRAVILMKARSDFSDNLEADETDEALLMRPPPPTTHSGKVPSPTRPPLPASSSSSRKNVGFVDEYSDDPFEGENRQRNAKSPGRPN